MEIIEVTENEKAIAIEYIDGARNWFKSDCQSWKMFMLTYHIEKEIVSKNLGDNHIRLFVDKGGNIIIARWKDVE